MPFKDVSRIQKISLILSGVLLIAIPLTVFAFISMRSTTPKAAGVFIDSLIPNTVRTASVTPSFSWNCNSCTNQPDYYTLWLSEDPILTQSATKSATFNRKKGFYKIITKNDSGTLLPSTNWGGWGSTTGYVPTTLKDSTKYYWDVNGFFGDMVDGSASGLPEAREEFTTRGPVDSDNDGFSDTLETNFGTKTDLACGLNSWPPDINNDKSVNSLDLAAQARYNGTTAGDLYTGSKYNRRYDLNADGKIDQADLNIVASYFGKTCS